MPLHRVTQLPYSTYSVGAVRLRLRSVGYIGFVAGSSLVQFFCQCFLLGAHDGVFCGCCFCGVGLSLQCWRVFGRNSHQSLRKRRVCLWRIVVLCATGSRLCQFRCSFLLLAVRQERVTKVVLDAMLIARSTLCQLPSTVAMAVHS
jgi:hypothetical protein